MRIAAGRGIERLAHTRSCHDSHDNDDSDDDEDGSEEDDEKSFVT